MSTQTKLTSMFSDKNVKEVEYEDTLSSSYLDYSVSTIVDRAVPDLKDGLKPVQRRVLYDMYDLGFTHNKPYRKTARISGDVIGRFHPHGQAGVETAIVTMAQPFKKPVTFIQGQGNWGSIEGDNPAAARYTECRLTEFSEDVFLDLLNFNTVDLMSNYDNTLKEPSVLPSKIPTVLLTGSEGIAVGMKTNIPTFNLSEIVDSNIYVLTHQKIDTDKILQIMPGPDFSTGGTVCNPSEMESLYETGQGRVRIRAKVKFEPGSGKERDRLIIEEIPYTMVGLSMISFMQDVVKLIESKELPDVVDVIDQTAEEARIVLELSKGSDVEYVKNLLFTKTKLEDVMSCNLLVVDEGVPRTVGVVEILKKFSEFQKEIYTKKYEYHLNEYQARKSILEAYVTFTSNVDDIVSIIRGSRSDSEARQSLYEKYHFTEDQANAILHLKLSKLVSMEVDKVKAELKDVTSKVADCQSILSDEKKLIRRIVSDLNSIKKKYGYDRRTQVQDIPVASIQKRQRPAKEVYVVVDRFSYVHCIDSTTYSRNTDAVHSDFTHHLLTTDQSKVIFMCENGMMYRVKVHDIPLTGLRGKGVPLDNLTSNKYSSHNNSIVSVVGEDKDVTVITRKGLGKKLLSVELQGSRTELLYITLTDQDRVVFCDDSVNDKTYIQFISNSNRVLKIKSSDIPQKRRGSKGVYLMKFRMDTDFLSDVLKTSDSSDVHSIGWYGVKLTNNEIEDLRALYTNSKTQNR